MDSVLKRRLIGAAVIIALAVIFVPMLFESPGPDSPVKSEIKIPQKPSYEIPNRLESKHIDENSGGQTSTQQGSPLDIKPDSPLINQFPGSSTTATKPAGQPNKQQVETTPPKPDTQGRQPPAVVVETSKMPQKPAKKPEKRPAATKPRTDGTGFVAQIGSFTQKQNAMVLADKLQASGYPAFVEEASTGSSMVYRVKLGPVDDREAAEKLLKKARKNEGLGGIVVSYP